MFYVRICSVQNKNWIVRDCYNENIAVRPLFNFVARSHQVVEWVFVLSMYSCEHVYKEKRNNKCVEHNIFSMVLRFVDSFYSRLGLGVICLQFCVVYVNRQSKANERYVYVYLYTGIIHIHRKRIHLCWFFIHMGTFNSSYRLIECV